VKNNPLPRLDLGAEETRRQLLPHCRLHTGEIWHDPEGDHTIGCGDACDASFIKRLLKNQPGPTLAIHDPPYNMVMGKKQTASKFVDWCRKWVDITSDNLADDASMYIWLGADQKDHFQPLPQFMLMMAETEFEARSFITMRNQRGYGTPKNWMHVRQELLCYTRGEPKFSVQYTDIPRLLKGYYKEVGGQSTENSERSRSETIRPGNVWVDIQQVFYRLEENVSGCYAQKPLKAIERIVEGLTCDIDPVFAELTIRRLEHFRATGRTGWQAGNPFGSDLGEKLKEDAAAARSMA